MNKLKCTLTTISLLTTFNEAELGNNSFNTYFQRFANLKLLNIFVEIKKKIQ